MTVEMEMDSEYARPDDRSTEAVSAARTLPPSGLLSPAASVTSSATSSSTRRSRHLPIPRSAPLKPGGQKESLLRAYLERQLRSIQRRGTLSSATKLRFTDQATGTTHLVEAEEVGPEIGHGIGDKYGEDGYTSYRQLANDLDTLVDMLWYSSTPSLQVQYFLNIALQAVNYIPSYPTAPGSMFRLLGKLDLAFASLIEGMNVRTREPLPRSDNGRPVLSTTDKVRLRGLVERTRVTVARAMDTTNFAVDEDDDDDDDEVDDKNKNRKDVEEMSLDEEDEEDEDQLDLRTGLVYERTVDALGETMGDMTLDQLEKDCS